MRNDSKISPIPPLKNRVHEFSRMTVVQGARGPALREKGICTLACLAGSPDPRSCYLVPAGKLSTPTMRYHPPAKPLWQRQFQFSALSDWNPLTRDQR